MLVHDQRKKIIENFDIIFAGEKVEQVKETQYLGIILDQNLNFVSHTYFIAKKVSKKISFLHRISDQVNDYTKVLIYKSTIALHYDYCSFLLININKKCMGLLQKTQNRAMRVNLKVNKYTPIVEMLNVLCFMSVEERVKFNTCVFIYKIINNLTPEYSTTMVKRAEHKYSTRNKDKLVIDKRKTTTTQKQLIRMASISLIN